MYKYQLFEIYDSNIALNTIAESTNPYFEDSVRNTPYYNLNTAILNMKVGQKYAWRVTVRDVDGVQKFKNNGKSDIFVFQYLNPPTPIPGLTVKVLNRDMTFAWDANQTQTSFDIEYYDYQTNRTTSGTCDENRRKLTAPKSNYKIKFRVRAICYGDENRKSDWSQWIEVQVLNTPERDTAFVCGKTYPDRDISNKELKTIFSEGEILESENGDTRFEMVGVSANNNGVLSGQFYMIADCWNGAKILCDFHRHKNQYRQYCTYNKFFKPRYSGLCC